MTLREAVFALALLLAVASVTYGVSLLAEWAGWIIGGVLGGVWAWLVLADQ